jgi:hypothetical protein
VIAFVDTRQQGARRALRQARYCIDVVSEPRCRAIDRGALGEPGCGEVTRERDAEEGREPVTGRGAQFRYGTVFLLTLAVVVLEIVAPTAN